MVLIPEVQFKLEGPTGLLAYLEKVLETKGHAVVCVAEGAGQVRLSGLEGGGVGGWGFGVGGWAGGRVGGMAGLGVSGKWASSLQNGLKVGGWQRFTCTSC